MMTSLQTTALPLALSVGFAFAALFFTAALLTGIWKWRAMLAAENGEAHRYVDIAHHAALHYGPSIALAGVLAAFWPVGDILPAWILVATIGLSMIGSLSRYILLGIRGGITNQLRRPDQTSRFGLVVFFLSTGLPGLMIGAGALVSLVASLLGA